MSSNQGRELSQLLDDVTSADITAASEVLWIEVGNHPVGASCECPALEALAVLYERGYRLVPQSQPDEQINPEAMRLAKQEREAE